MSIVPKNRTLKAFSAVFAPNVPQLGTLNTSAPFNSDLAHVENGVFTCQERMSGFESTGYDPFIFAFLVRDGVQDEEQEHSGTGGQEGFDG